MTTLYYCADDGGFYGTDLHGERTMLVDDPAWTAPMIPMAVPPIDGQAAEPAQTVMVPDPKAVAPQIRVPNPHCTLPADERLVEIDADHFDQLMAAQARGMRLVCGDDGRPVAAPPAEPSTDQLAANARSKRDRLLDEATAQLQRHLLQRAYNQPTTLTEDQAAELAIYAQALRDVPQQDAFPTAIEWPAPPALPESTPTTEASP